MGGVVRMGGVFFERFGVGHYQPHRFLSYESSLLHYLEASSVIAPILTNYNPQEYG